MLAQLSVLVRIQICGLSGPANFIHHLIRNGVRFSTFLLSWITIKVKMFYSQLLMVRTAETRSDSKMAEPILLASSSECTRLLRYDHPFLSSPPLSIAGQKGPAGQDLASGALGQEAEQDHDCSDRY